jgi:hypothetical protein
MKLICTVVGTLIVLIIVLLSPWPDFILRVGNNLLANPEARGDIIWEYLIKGFVITVSYVIFPLLGGVIGFITGYIINIKLD